jgi:hypothetical protein
MASISLVSTLTLSTPPIGQATQTASTATPRATAVNDPANDITTYVTNADGSVNVTTTNAQGEILEISTLPSPVAATAGGRSGASQLAAGSLLSRVA